jgi:hypothetical protein
LQQGSRVKQRHTEEHTPLLRERERYTTTPTRTYSTTS